MKQKFTALTTSISTKQAIRLKNLEKSKQPISIKHIITDHYGQRYSVELDFINGYTESEAIGAVNNSFALLEGRPVSVELVSISAIPDRSEYVKPKGEC